MLVNNGRSGCGFKVLNFVPDLFRQKPPAPMYCSPAPLVINQVGGADIVQSQRE